MLTELHIQNFAIIEELDLHFDQGLTVFTGETGAGKSIIIDAVETLMGARAEAVLVRSGAERASIEAVFRIPESIRTPIIRILDREDLLDEPDYVTLSREIRAAGRNISRVNGRSVSASLLRELGEYLVDVHGQSEHLSLLRVRQHLELLDRYAGASPDNPLPGQLKDYRWGYRRLAKVQQEIAEIRQVEQDADRRKELLTYQVQEIKAANLHLNEDAQLLEERTRLANAEGLASLVQESLLALDEGGPENPAAIDLLGQVTQALAGLARLDPSQTRLSEEAQNLFEGLNELSLALRAYLESVEFNPKRLDQVEERLVLIQTLKQKYADSIPGILEYAIHAKRQLEEISYASERLDALVEEETGLLDRLGELGQALSQTRQEAARLLERGVEEELSDLNMADARFKVEFYREPDPDGIPTPGGERFAYTEAGLERIEFLIAPNPGEGLKPLVKIASGGETSRLMLALKNVLVQADRVPTLIFDEIDQGIGGRIGAIVGQKLWLLGRGHQVLCITHLPQLAAYARQHFHVAKQIQSGRTTTQVTSLEGQQRLVELAQMLGTISEGTLHSARELMQVVERSTTRPTRRAS